MYKLTTVLALFVLLNTGCTNYYKIVDPGTGKAYYTTDYEEKRNGAVVFTDDATGSVVTIQNSEVSEVPKETFVVETSK